MAKKNVSFWYNLDKQKLRKLIKKKCNKIMKRIFFKNLFNIGYAQKNKNNVKKGKYLVFLIKAFQRRFRQELVDGKIDQECLLISQNLIQNRH